MGLGAPSLKPEKCDVLVRLGKIKKVPRRDYFILKILKRGSTTFSTQNFQKSHKWWQSFEEAYEPWEERYPLTVKGHPHVLDEWHKLRSQENCLGRKTVKNGIIYIDYMGSLRLTLGESITQSSPLPGRQFGWPRNQSWRTDSRKQKPGSSTRDEEDPTTLKGARQR